MKLRKVLALVLVCAMAVTTFAACSSAPASSGSESSTSSAASSESSAEESKESSTAESSTPESSATSNDLYPGTPGDNEITVDIGTEPDKLNTLTATYSHSFSVIRHFMENLVELDKDDKVIPGVAESWEASEDGLNYTFHLREGMKWTNGEPVTANDFVFAWKTILTPATASNYAYFAYIFKNGEAFYKGEATEEELGFKAVDDYTLEVTLENPIPYFLSMLAHGSLAPVNQKFYEEVGADNYATEAKNMCTNGPFKMTSWTHDSNIVLEKNPDFFKADEVSLEKITFAMYKTTDTALNSFKAGEADMIGLNGDQVTQMTAEGYPIQSYSDGSEFHVLFNLNDPYVSNLNLRKAINLAYSRQDYITALVKDQSTPATSFTNPGVAGADGTSFEAAVQAKYGILNQPDSDPEKAKEYLDAALKELNITVEELSKNLSMNCGDSDTATKQAAFFQEQLRLNLGLEISIKSMTTKAQSEERDNRNYCMDFTGWGPDYNDPMTFLDMWVTGNGNNSVDFSNARYDELIGLAQKETDLNKRQEYFLECEKILADEVPISCTYWRVRSYITSGKVTGNYWRTTFSDINFVYATVK